ncbi:heavy metal-responsive transcriptional regulator [Euzebya sp.]|uniref:heavy metal-responsive transcriptional regulator n=1 Tax=Euzebya sp. TaxID=1971409 RepID=UPI0035156651
MRIGQLADRFGLNPKTIRYYESIALLPEPARTASGYRVYGEADAERLSFIRTAQRLGLSLDDIREILGFHERGERPCGHVVALLRRHTAELDQRIAEMQDLRAELTALVARASDLDDGTGTFCGVIEHHVEHAAPAARRR